MRADTSPTDFDHIGVRAAVAAPVAIVDVFSGRLMSTFTPNGRVQGLALSRHIAAVLVQLGGQSGSRFTILEPAS